MWMRWSSRQAHLVHHITPWSFRNRSPQIMKTGAADKATTRYAGAYGGAALPRMSCPAGPTAGCAGGVGNAARQGRRFGSTPRSEQFQLVAAALGQSARRPTTGREK